MEIENLKKLKSTNPIVQNAIAHCIARNEGTSEGAKKGWETRKAGGVGGEKDDPWAKDRGSKGPERWHFDDSKTPTESNFKNLKKGDMIPSPYSDTMVEVKSIIVDGDVGIIDAVTEDGDEWEIHAEDYGIEHPGGKNAKNAVKGQRIHSTNPVVENALEYAANRPDGEQKEKLEAGIRAREEKQKKLVDRYRRMLQKRKEQGVTREKRTMMGDISWNSTREKR